MAKRRKRRPKEPVPTVSYAGEDGSVLSLRGELSAGTIREINAGPARAATSAEDAWHRRQELLFERLAVSWEVAGLPLGDQKLLLGRYRMATPAEQEWVRRTIADHVERHIPELAG